MSQKVESKSMASTPIKADRRQSYQSGRFVPDLLERGGPVRGEPQALDSRLFIQLQAFTGCFDTAPIVDSVRDSGLEVVVYSNLNDARGIGILVMAEDPLVFSEAARSMFLSLPFRNLTPLPNFTMFGRTYATGREPDLDYWLLRKARNYALNPNYTWAVWYPLRRLGTFSQLAMSEQAQVLGEHASIGRGYGQSGYAVDIRLECHGLDRDDNEFVLGLLGAELHPLSKLVKDMRGTRQTSEFMQTMGPFFVGRAIYQSPLSEKIKEAPSS